MNDYSQEEFRLPEGVNALRLSNWKEIAMQQIKRFYEDEDFYLYISKEVFKNDENPPGPFTRFLYWFGFSCKGCGWGVMVDFNEYRQRTVLCDRYYKWMHQVRDEMNLEV